MMTLACWVLSWAVLGPQSPVVAQEAVQQGAQQQGAVPELSAQEEAARQEMASVRSKEAAVLQRREEIAARAGVLVGALERACVKDSRPFYSSESGPRGRVRMSASPIIWPVWVSTHLMMRSKVDTFSRAI